MDQDLYENIHRAARQGAYQTASFGASLNYTRADKVVSDARPVLQHRAGAPRMPKHVRYPPHAEEVYKNVAHEKAAHRKRPPWATNGTQKTGVSEAAEEYSAKANENFETLLKKQYRKLRIKGERTSADMEADNTPPVTPEFYRRKALTLKSLSQKHRAQSAGPRKVAVAAADTATSCLTPPPQHRPHTRSGTFDRIFHTDDGTRARPGERYGHYGKAICGPPKPQEKMHAFPETKHDHEKNSYWPTKREDLLSRNRRKHNPCTSIQKVWDEERDPLKMRRRGKKYPKRDACEIGDVCGFDVHPKTTAKRAWTRRSIAEVMDAYQRQMRKTAAADARSQRLNEEVEEYKASVSMSDAARRD